MYKQHFKKNLDENLSSPKVVTSWFISLQRYYMSLASKLGTYLCIKKYIYFNLVLMGPILHGFFTIGDCHGCWQVVQWWLYERQCHLFFSGFLTVRVVWLWESTYAENFQNCSTAKIHIALMPGPKLGPLGIAGTMGLLAPP